MSDEDQEKMSEEDAARLRSRNRAVGLSLLGFVIFLFVVSYFKIEVAAG